MSQKSGLTMKSDSLSLEEMIKLLVDYTVLIFSLKNSKESHSNTFDTDINGSTPNKSVRGESSPYETVEARFLSCDSLGPPIPQISLFQSKQATSIAKMPETAPSGEIRTPSKRKSNKRINFLSGGDTPLSNIMTNRGNSQSSKDIRLDGVEPMTDRRSYRISLYPETGAAVDIYSGGKSQTEEQQLRCMIPQRTPRPSRFDGRSGSSEAVDPAISSTSNESKRSLIEFRGISSAFNFGAPKLSVLLTPSGSTSWISQAPKIQLKPKAKGKFLGVKKEAQPTPQHLFAQNEANAGNNKSLESRNKKFERSMQEDSCQNHVIPARPGLGKSGSAKVVRFMDPQPTVSPQSGSGQVQTFAKPSSRSGSAASDDTRLSSKLSSISKQPLVHGILATAETKSRRKLKLKIVESAHKVGASPMNSPLRAAGPTDHIGPAHFVGSRPASPKVSAPGSPVSRPVHRTLLEHLSIFSRRSYVDAMESRTNEQC